MKGFKGFDRDLKCRGFQFEAGKTYKHKGDAVPCSSGFHFCENPLDVFSYYGPAKSRYAEVDGNGQMAKHNGDSKVACTEMTIGAEIGVKGIIGSAIKFVFNLTKSSKETKSTTGNYAHSATTGNYAHSAVNGKESIACGLGIQNQAKGKKSCWLVLSEWEEKGGEWKIKSVKSVKVDGKTIKEDTFYTLKNGKFVEVK